MQFSWWVSLRFISGKREKKVGISWVKRRFVIEIYSLFTTRDLNKYNCVPMVTRLSFPLPSSSSSSSSVVTLSRRTKSQTLRNSNSNAPKKRPISSLCSHSTRTNHTYSSHHTTFMHRLGAHWERLCLKHIFPAPKNTQHGESTGRRVSDPYKIHGTK